MARYKKKEIDLDRFLQMRAEGMPMMSISKELGVSIQSLYEKMRVAGLTQQRQPSLDKGKIMALHRAKRTPKWISIDMHIPIEIVADVITKNEIRGSQW